MTGDQSEQAEESTSAIPGYQPTESLDREQLAKVLAKQPTETTTAAEPAPPPVPRHHDTDEIARRLPRPVVVVPAPEREVVVIDLPVFRLRRPGDLMASILAVLGIVLVLLLAVFAHATTEGVTQDVQNALPQALTTFLLTPVQFLEGVVTLVLPLVIALERLIRRQPRMVGEALLGGLVAIFVVVGANWLLLEVGPDALVDGVRSTRGTSFVPGIAGLAAYLTITGSSGRRRLISWTWNLLWVTIVLQVLRSGMTLPGALASVLAGRSVGMVARYITGVLGDRAYGEDLVRALRRCGIDPERVLRILDGRPVEGVDPSVVVTDEPIGYVTEEAAAPTAAVARLAADGPAADGLTPDPLTPDTLPAEVPPPVIPPRDLTPEQAERLRTTWDFTGDLPRVPEPAPSSEPERSRPPLRTATAVIGEEEGENRIYSVRDSSGRLWDVGVLDGDRQVVGALATFWNTIRLRGLSQRTVVSLRVAVERAALLSYAAVAAGVRTPPLRGMTAEQDSAILVSEHIPGTQMLADVQTRRLTDDVLDRIWHEVRTAHAAGLAHRELDDHAILLDGQDRVWLTNWASGEMSSPQLSRRLDLVHLLALLALRLGPERAMASAVRNLTEDDLRSIAPLFQPVAMPERTRAEVRRNRRVLKEVQELLIAVIPTAADVEPMQMRRFSARTIISVTIAVIVGWIVLTSFNLTEMIGYIREADARWLAVAFVVGMTTYVGAALSLVAFSPVRLSVWRTTLVQLAASVVGLVAPAGVGPAALNLRFLQKSKLDTPMAVATVALVQVSQFFTTILLLVALFLATGSTTALSGLPSGAVLLVIGGVVVVVGSLLAVPRIRRWVVAKVMPTLRQIWPRLVWVVGQPQRLLMGILGNVVMTAGYVAAFGITLLAFGHTLSLSTLAIVYLAGNAAGAAVPTPGGIGAIELTLAAGLRTAGIAQPVALSTAFGFRLLTFWVRVPLGWLALRYLQKRGLV